MQYVCTYRSLCAIPVYKQEFAFNIWVQRGVCVQYLCTKRSLHSISGYKEEFPCNICVQRGVCVQYLCTKRSLHSISVYKEEFACKIWVQRGLRAISMYKEENCTPCVYTIIKSCPYTTTKMPVYFHFMLTFHYGTFDFKRIHNRCTWRFQHLSPINRRLLPENTRSKGYNSLIGQSSQKIVNVGTLHPMKITVIFKLALSYYLGSPKSIMKMNRFKLHKF